jgi:hypothetical protein
VKLSFEFRGKNGQKPADYLRVEFYHVTIKQEESLALNIKSGDSLQYAYGTQHQVELFVKS